MTLTDIAIRSAKPKDKQYKLSDGEGMYLLVKPNGGKYWKLKYRFANREKTLSIGAYPIVPLAEARDKKLDAKRKLLDNIDPSEAKQELRREILRQTKNSLEIMAREWHDNQKPGWTERHANCSSIKKISGDS